MIIIAAIAKVAIPKGQPAIWLPPPLNTYTHNKDQTIHISRACNSSRHVMYYTNQSPEALTCHSKTRRSVCKYIWSWGGL